MGGVDKAALRVAGTTLLDRVLLAAEPLCDRLVVVGPARETEVGDVLFVTEGEPGGGPAPAVLAGVDAAPDCDTAFVLAVDLPLLRTAHLRRLLEALQDPGVEAAAAAASGDPGKRRPNPVLAVYGVASLRARAAKRGVGPGSPAGALLPASTVAVDLGPGAVNVNEPDDLLAAELLSGYPEGVVVVAYWLRGVVTAAVPDAVETVYTGWKGFGYRTSGAGYFCAVFPRPAGAQLSFEHGALLPDPHGLLRGDGRQVRHVDVRAVDDPPAAHLVELLDAAVERGQAGGTGRVTRRP